MPLLYKANPESRVVRRVVIKLAKAEPKSRYAWSLEKSGCSGRRERPAGTFRRLRRNDPAMQDECYEYAPLVQNRAVPKKDYRP